MGAGKISTSVQMRVRSENEGGSEGEVKRVLFSSKVTSARSCLSFLDPFVMSIGIQKH